MPKKYKKSSSPRVEAEVTHVRRNGWGEASVTRNASTYDKTMVVRVGHTIAIPKKRMQGVKVGTLVSCRVKRNDRGPGHPRWFAIQATRATPEKSDIVWEPWQVDGILLPNTQRGSQHQIGGACQWGLACWKCGHAKVDARQIHQIKNSAVWTNTGDLDGTELDAEIGWNKHKKCHVQKLCCSKCKRSLGSYYAEPYYDSETKALTTYKVFPCVKLTTMWSKQGQIKRCAMVVTGPSESEVQDVLAQIPRDGGAEYAEFGRLDEFSKRLIMQGQAAKKSHEQTMMINVNISGNVRALTIARNTSVAALKQLLEARSGLAREHQRLVFAGRDLPDTASLNQLAESGTVLHVVRANMPVSAADANDENNVGGGRKQDIAGGGAKRVRDAAEPAGQIGSEREMQDNMRRMIGATFAEMTNATALASGCNGAVFAADFRGVRVALKVMFNYGLSTEAAAVQQRSEYFFLRHVPHHHNIVNVLSVIQRERLTKQLADLLPVENKKLLSQYNARTGERTLRSTTGLVLEYLPLTLNAFVLDVGSEMTREMATALAVQIVDAAAHLKKHGLVHCDMKTDNVMIEYHPDGLKPPRVVIVDFGCSVVRGNRQLDMDESFTVHGRAANPFPMGNPAHVAPEVLVALKRQGAIPRGDERRVPIPLQHQGAFSAGVLLFELAMGSVHPLGDYPAHGACQKHFEKIDFATLAQRCGHGYSSVVKGLLQFDPEKRMTLTAAQERLGQLMVK